jgi:biotin carboxylase
MEAALASMRVEGVTTNLGMQRKILGWEAFRSGAYDTTSLETWMRSVAA